jgi:diguanylate cyclase (GGDEF)-like protein
MLHEISGILQTCMTEDRIYDLTIEAAGRLLEFDACTLTVSESDEPGLKASVIPWDMDLEGKDSLNPVIAEMTFANKETILFETDMARRETPGAEMRSGISAAIGEFGVFQAVSRRKHAFPDSDLRLLELLLGYTTLGIRRLRLQTDLRVQATHDPLTGVFNRNYFDHIMEVESHRAERYGRPVGFLMIDIDRFKEVNDTLGHLIGDKVLMCVARIIEATIRKTDIVVRYGGDEFLVILTETGAGTTKVIDRIKSGVAGNEELASLAGQPVTVSVGSAFWEPGSGCSIDETLRIADRMMYVDKSRGVLEGS